MGKLSWFSDDGLREIVEKSVPEQIAWARANFSPRVGEKLETVFKSTGLLAEEVLSLRQELAGRSEPRLVDAVGGDVCRVVTEKS